MRSPRVKAGMDRGAALVEFVIVFPLVVMFFLGLLVVGRTIQPIPWIMQTCYEAMRIGADTVSGQTQMQDRFNLLFNSHVQRGEINPDLGLVPEVEYFDDGNDNHFVRVSTTANIKPLGPTAGLVFPVNLWVVGAHLARSEPPLGDLNDFPGAEECGSCESIEPGNFRPPFFVGGMHSGKDAWRETPTGYEFANPIFLEPDLLEAVPFTP